MGNLNLNCGALQQFDANIIVEDGGHKVVNLKIESESENVEYRICSDDREPDLYKILKDLKSKLKRAKDNHDVDFNIQEDPERIYINIDYSNGESKQYTGQRLSYTSKVAFWK